ncbi:hypothetical protein UlMin_006841 [Ulmus minor]
MVLHIAVEDVKQEVKILQELQGHENRGNELLYQILAKKNSHTEKDAVVVVFDLPLKATYFGLSNFIKPGKKFQDIVGSAYYIAPEVLKRKSGLESNVWRVGVIIYIMLCGRRPFWDNIKDGIFKEVLASTLDEADPTSKINLMQLINFWLHGLKATSLKVLKTYSLQFLIDTALTKDLPWKLKESRVLEILPAIDSNTNGLVDFSEFVAATLHVHQLEEHDSDKWQQRSKVAFEKFDIDKDGYITPEELRLPTGLRGFIDPFLEEANIEKHGKIS